ncbi:MAG: holo-ACP synthase [Coriobacteriia bacterium]|nr:holo-ACP synthase [Coriobacteriia bacterium]
MKQVGLGVDIVDIARMEEILIRTSNFANFTFTEDEISYCNARGNSVTHFATHFAAKEATLKCLGTGFLHGIGPKDVEVRHNNSGAPYIVLHGPAKKIADEMDISNIPISLSYTHTEAVAIAVAMKDEYARSKVDEVKQQDIASELTAQFKEAKKLL